MDKQNLTIQIRVRKYNGLLTIGSILGEKYTFKYENSIATSTSEIDFVVDPAMGSTHNANLVVTIPVSILPEEFSKLEQLISEIKENPGYQYQESHYSKTGMDMKYYDYMDVIINDQDFEIPANDSTLSTLSNLLNFQVSSSSLYKAYDCLVQTYKQK